MTPWPEGEPEHEAWGHGYLLDARGHQVHYTRGGSGPPVVCLHGWPGFWFDYRRLRPLLEAEADVVAIDLRGFGASDRPALPAVGYGRDAQAAMVRDVLDDLGFDEVVLVGHDMGSAVAIQIARDAPDRVGGLALGNPVHPGAGRLALSPDHRGEFWYQDFHRLRLAEELIDGEPAAVEAYLRHFYRHWSGRPNVIGAAHIAALVRTYAEPGAFTASLNWYRSGSSTVFAAMAARSAAPQPPVEVPAAVVWGAADPVFPLPFAEGLTQTLPRHTMTVLDHVGHFVPLEAPQEMAAAVRSML
ncbi:alpha/beta fold hydrolase [Pseudonocardia sp. H11422]|uniref:alpha/beta fold hydrolase n=1 Tax=Pseudonocardia sp. H11422 TaxID=2835866 RepID=UPI001BDD2399|nr:alpha/beta hydrolase [Pseudonocardia sp. H11422]